MQKKKKIFVKTEKNELKISFGLKTKLWQIKICDNYFSFNKINDYNFFDKKMLHLKVMKKFCDKTLDTK